MIIQFLIVAFSVFAAFRLFFKFKKGSLRIGEFFFWLLLWTVIAAAAILPESTSFMARLLGVGRGVDLVIYLSIMALFYAVFRIFIRLEKIDQDITKIVRKVSLEEQRDKDNN